MDYAVCSCCKQPKLPTEFHKDSGRACGHHQRCKACTKAMNARARATRRAYDTAYRQANPDRVVHNRATYYARHRDRRLELTLQWQRDNPGKVAAKSRARTASKLRATPAWANLELIELLYVEAADLSGYPLRGKLHVDHIVPLRSKYVCGLHTEANLRVIPATENIRKSNRFWPDMA